MKKLLSLFITIALVGTLTACSGKNAAESELISDPFESVGDVDVNPFKPDSSAPNNPTADSSAPSSSTSDSTDENPTRDKFFLLMSGGYICNVENTTFEYNGSPITVPVTMSANESCGASISIGLSCYINGVPQQISDGGEAATMIIKENVEPGQTLDLTVSLTPVVPEEDAEKDELPLTFISYYNPDYTPNEEFVAFGYLRDGSAVERTLKLAQKPSETVQMSAETDCTELLRTKENLKKYKISNYSQTSGQSSFYWQNGKTSGGTLKRDDSGKVKFNFVLDNYSAGDYELIVMKNNETIKFNNGKDYVKAAVKDEHIYDFEFEIENVQRGDIIQILVPAKGQEFCPLVSNPVLIVNSDFGTN